MKFKLLVALLSISFLSQNVFVYAEETQIEKQKFNPDLVFSNYVSYEKLDEDIFAVSNSNNKKALFYKEEQLTDFIFNSISEIDEINVIGFIVNQTIDNKETYGLLIVEDMYNSQNRKFNYFLPTKYKNIKEQKVNGFNVIVAEKFDGNSEYYLEKIHFEAMKSTYYNSTFEIKYEDLDRFIKLNSINDVPNPYDYSSYSKKQIKGSDMYVINSGRYYIVDKNGNKLIEQGFGKIDESISPGNTLIVWILDESMRGWKDSISVLNKELKTIIEPYKGYTQILFYEDNGNTYIKATNDSPPFSECYKLDYYDLQGNIIEKPQNSTAVVGGDISSWAKESVQEAINLGIVPQEIQERYTAKISRAEFAKLAVQAYVAKTGYKVDINAKSPFEDTSDPYVTAAYNLKIVSGTSKTRFSGGNTITRQEAALMMNNLAKLLNVKSTPQKQKFVDEKYFATWAKDAIYYVAGIKSGDTYVMAGTGQGKFSPWYNYTIEQAISSMLRLYKCS